MDDDPPILPHEFEKRFYACYDPTTLHKLNPWHKCRGACRTHGAVDRLPKRSTALDEDVDDREEFWGLYAREIPSVLAFVLWNLALFILGPLIFGIVWLVKHPGDLQNASVPMTISTTLLGIW
jgi:hypothetical protein